MKEVNKDICGYVLPSVASFLVTFLYIVIDGIFVGRGVGSDALAAVNLALPFAALVTSLSSLVAMGGASVSAIRLGRGDALGAGRAAATSVAITLVASLSISAVGMLFPEAIARWSGAGGRLLQPTAEYVHYYSMFAVFVTSGICLSALVRNDGRPGLAFWGMIAGAVANVFLDWLFIFPLGMGIKGAAVASGIGQILSVAVLVTHFIGGKGRLRLRPSLIAPGLAGKICLRGFPEFVTQISQPVTVLFFNYMILRRLDEIGVAAYAVVCTLASLIFAVQVGVAGGMQPLFGRSFGEKNKTLVRYFYRAGVTVNLAASGLLYCALALGAGGIVALFSADAELRGIAARGLFFYGLAYVPAALNVTVTSFFLSTKRTGWAMLIAVVRGCVLNVLCIVILPALFGSDALWCSLVVVETLTAALSLFLVNRSWSRRNPDSIILMRKTPA